MSSSETRGVRRLHIPSSFTDDAGLQPFTTVSALPGNPTLRFPWGGSAFGASLRLAFAYDLSMGLPSCRSGLGLRLAHEDFYSQAFDGLVTRTVAGRKISSYLEKGFISDVAVSNGIVMCPPSVNCRTVSDCPRFGR